MKRSYECLIAVTFIIINVIIVYFGRIYFPINFQPKTVPFFENLWVLILGECFIIIIGCLVILGFVFIITNLYKDIKSLFS